MVVAQLDINAATNTTLIKRVNIERVIFGFGYYHTSDSRGLMDFDCITCQLNEETIVSEMRDNAGSLYVVATPIGNLDDISTRACRVLSSVAYIAAEDTRHTGSLLRHLGIDTPMRAYHDHNEVAQSEKIVADLKNGKEVAIVSDAGTPQISDPGYRVVRLALSEGLIVVPIPGASALSSALSVSGVAASRFTFEGFLPAKEQQRQKALMKLSHETRTMVFYEAPHRIAVVINDMQRTFGGDRQLSIARELTKIHEQIFFGSITSAVQALSEGVIPSKGEFVIIVEGASESAVLIDPGLEKVMQTLINELPASRAADVASKLTGESRKSLYEIAVSFKKSNLK